MSCAKARQLKFEIEKALPGFVTVTDSDIEWIKHWWKHDGHDPHLADRLVAEYRT